MAFLTIFALQQRDLAMALHIALSLHTLDSSRPLTLSSTRLELPRETPEPVPKTGPQHRLRRLPLRQLLCDGRLLLRSMR